MPLCAEIFRNYEYKINSSGASFNDLFSDRYYVFWKSVRSYNPHKNTKFSTWLSHMVRFHCLSAIYDHNRYVCYGPKDMEYITDSPVKITNREATYDEERGSMLLGENLQELKDYIFYILSQLKDKRIKKIFELRCYEDKLTWKEIAQIAGVTTVTAMNLFERAKKILKEKLKNNSFLDNI